MAFPVVCVKVKVTTVEIFTQRYSEVSLLHGAYTVNGTAFFRFSKDAIWINSEVNPGYSNRINSSSFQM